MGTSFYGSNGGGTNGGGGGVTNYNELTSKPIVNILGGNPPIDLSALKAGLYNAQGKYVFNTEDTVVKSFVSPTLVKVGMDDTTSDKVVAFDICENGKYITYNILYFTDGTHKVNKFTYETINTKAESTEDLPEVGDATQIYSTDKGFFVWNEDIQDYVKLGTPVEVISWEML